MVRLGKFHTEVTHQSIAVDLQTLDKGIHNLNDFILRIGDNREVSYVIDKICDHAGGKLIVKGEQAVCPMHNWHLNLTTLHYNDSHIQKKKLDYRIDEGGKLHIDKPLRSLVNPFRSAKNGEVTVRWLNHATAYIECNGISIITDPWLFGPAFLTGWWLLTPSPSDAIDLLKKVDYIYISHNHPDHLHPETLSIVDKQTKILTPRFTSGSSEKLLRSLGFTNIITCDFLDIHELAPGFQISIMKSGDFRDDSGIYISANGHELLLTVDANFLNGNVVPRNIDLLMSSFAGGASGFPLCYENYTEAEKNVILDRNRNSIKLSVINYIKACEPTYYMPYAGMFSEYSPRDFYIKSSNLKNTFENYKLIAAQLSVTPIRPESDKVVRFKNGELDIEVLENVSYLQQENQNFYIDHFKKDFPYDIKKVLSYFENSGYNKKQIVQIIPMNDDFTVKVGEIAFADFHLAIFKSITENELISQREGYRVMTIKVRAEVFMCLVENHLPWEDMSIGFQIRVSRTPNEYESEFWYHFTNNYISQSNFRYSSYCGACSIINQNPIWAKH